MRRNLLLDYLVYLAVRLFICVVQATRIETGREMARWLAWLAGDVSLSSEELVDQLSAIVDAFGESSLFRD